uniref:Uncharacterized protein n=1 Tax=Anopheles atroparvus TaxID=41427 RepID=A0A182IRC4_ANOAO
MAEAQRMKMLNGHFVWLWMDTTSATEFYEAGQTTYSPKQQLEAGAAMGGRSDQENDFYDTFDLRHHSHLADLVERRMEFEDFDPRRKNRTRAYIDGHTARFGSAALINPQPEGDDGPQVDALGSPDKTKQARRPAKVKGGGRGQKGNHTVVDASIRRAERFDEFLADSEEFDDFEDEEESRVLPLTVAEDELELTGAPGQEMKLKRSSEYHLKPHNSSGHVLFHHNQDFPVGLLALRPIKMKIDRHFIRATVRLFAATWAKVERDEAPTAGKGRSWQSSGSISATAPPKGGQRGQRPGQAPQKRSVGDNILTLPVNSANTQQSVHETSFLRKQPEPTAAAAEGVGSGPLVTPERAEKSRQAATNETNDIISPISNSSANFSDVGSTNNSSRVKRQSTWWSATTNHKYNADRTGGAGERGRGRGGATRYKGGCMGSINRAEQTKAYNFARNLQANARQALSGFPIASGFIEKSLVSHFEILNLVPTTRQSSSSSKADHTGASQADGGRYYGTSANGTASAGSGMAGARTAKATNTGTATKWRRVGLITGRSVHLDTIIWPGGDVTVSGVYVNCNVCPTALHSRKDGPIRAVSGLLGSP